MRSDGTVASGDVTGNGFLSSSPTVRFGSSSTSLGLNIAEGQRFVCPGSGTVTINEIGAWVSADVSTTGAFRFSIWTHDGTNDLPNAMVANSESSELSHNTTTFTKKSYTYGTKPSLTGGTTYWLIIFGADANLNLSWIGTGPSKYVEAAAYPTWPDNARWIAGGAVENKDVGFYAVVDP